MKDFLSAERKAAALEGVKGVSVTSYAVFAHGPDKWVCAYARCLAVSPKGPPLEQHVCRCGAFLSP